jgi:hypothetical protein
MSNETNTTPANVEAIPASPEPTGPARLHPAIAGRLATAVARYEQLTDSLKLDANGQPTCIITPDTQTQVSERAGLEKFITATMLRHARELIGSWNCIKQEYEPILRSVSIIFARVGLGPNENQTAEPKQ